MGFYQIIAKYRNSRKVLLFIVYIALFLDNMLLTTVVPIIPEYLLRISHPNHTNLLLYNKGTADHDIVKRQIVWDDEAWDMPMPGSAETDFPIEESTIQPIQRNYGRRRQKNKQKPTELSRNTAVTKSCLIVRWSSTQSTPTLYTTSVDQNKLRHDILATENVLVGLMFGSKALVQLIANPWIGPLTNKQVLLYFKNMVVMTITMGYFRIGYTLPMFAGFVIMFLSTIMFAFGSSYGTLWLARAMQGIGSACTSTSGMGMLAQAYTDDLERGSAMGIALGGLALGVLVGPPYGGVLYQWGGKELPFILLALLALFDGSLQFIVLQPKINRGEPEGSTLKQLIKDPYIIVAAGAITIGNIGIAMLEPSLPLWMMETWEAGSLERGAAFLPASVSYLVGTNVFGPLAHKIGRWFSALTGLVVIGFSLLSIPSAKSVTGLIFPLLFMGFSIGMIDASMFPLMGNLVDMRHIGVYGSIYAIADAAFCFAFALGPFFSGPLVKSLGFPT
ncbi:transporter, major facilitator family protein [Dictyocaulus viviparus]|uniref:Transporter, major facilitator family protein n=1 Tax=Dictyocaulus viviparus TaxID=29172 RepID=A0A0D8XLY8_DICVI|nr:transporter, major facilitator family protein [Dictyocaulus viviparus]